MIENCSVIFYARDGCESFYTAKVNSRRTQFEHNKSAFPPLADIRADIVDGSFVPISDIAPELSRSKRDTC
jgi:hypothetical protein